MSSNFIDFDQMLDDFLNQPIKQKIHSSVINYKLLQPHYIDKTMNELFENENFVEENEELEELQHLIDNTSYKPKLNFNSHYILGINEYGLRFAQYSNNYLFDDLMNIKTFISAEHKKFNRNLNILYFIDEKHKFKYLEKAKKRNKKTLYFDDSFGTKILNYIDGQKMSILGDKYGVQNYILDNITRDDNLEKKFIIILSFDVNMFEIYYSVPYTMYEKGSNELENELVYCCRLDEIEPNEILTYLDENAEHYA